MIDPMIRLQDPVFNGWDMSIEWHSDAYPCVNISVRKNFSRIIRTGYGSGLTLVLAFNEALDEIISKLKL